MNRHTYRGWDATGQKGWVYGDLVHNQKVTLTGTEPRTMVGGYEVISESVGQYTGLKDKEGREIHEGDILNVSYGGKIVMTTTVVWLDIYAGFYMDEGEGCYSLIPAKYSEVVGNEYEQKLKNN